ncbi:3-carboxy-cis,cis-muconate cycloisomerase [Rhodoplanes sp. TEM]|uniref:3-carboxy-cis,cis-muconate cycloisomerase n=1 Tax=Rhodoplanes tepidamans TaxID=200616 RepID=A0ABT5J840_RHOTP|nr:MULTISPECIES: 3-carboxy-cis,cis-muconate cycloisomerase [Rhodoplanes]MDC7785822.1 3-carboxy-cis,cis-muconate cycloisomerase [Rhodoplanes tepidamans]MDC7984089.1 3-carboxy-cis,cis-muconate cycloisomerase [Rhodoplanes sp. TEM]MDQ0354615.1 3-carboxy-cis,cis-muconate cycloisomerase [Rhodoplanes tepidamans]
MPATAIDSMILRDVFATTAMRRIFSDEHRLKLYLDIESALARVQAELGVIPAAAAEEIARHCAVDEFDLEKLKRDTERIGAPVQPVVAQLTALCRDDLGQWCHYGATTQDIMDTATALQMRAAFAMIDAELADIAEALADLAGGHRDTVMAARSQLQHAIPTTFGFKMAGVLAAVLRDRARLAQLSPRVLVGQFGGAVGTLASLGDKGPAVHAALMAELGLAAPEIAWHTARDRVAEAGAFLALATGTCGKLARDVTLLMQTEVAEAAEAAAPGRGSSSTMPQKRNPVSSVMIQAAVPVVRQLAGTLFEAMVEDHERASGAWQIEWIVVPEIFCLAAGVLAHTRALVSGLTVDAGRMRSNLGITNGLVTAEAVAMGLAPVMGRATAHHLVAELSREALKSGRALADLLKESEAVTRHLDPDAIDQLCDPANYTGSAGAAVDRVLALHAARDA